VSSLVSNIVGHNLGLDITIRFTKDECIPTFSYENLVVDPELYR